MELSSLAGSILSSNMDNSSDWLSYYASVFDYVEIDSSFYRMPNLFTVKNWLKKHLRILSSQPNFQKLLHMINV